jgi:hypothetical protein
MTLGPSQNGTKDGVRGNYGQFPENKKILSTWF